MRPGWVRLSFNYFIDDEECEYLLRALELVAEHGWRLLPFYAYSAEQGIWRYQGRHHSRRDPLASLRWREVAVDDPGAAAAPTLAELSAMAELELRRDDRDLPSHDLALSPAHEALRWFVLPQEITASTRFVSEVGAIGG